jgi:flagellar secretion chaperone FliS
MNSRDLAYRKSAAQGASGLGLLIALYDTVIGDLRRAAAAQRAGDLERRAAELKHALLVLSYLQNWTDAERGDLASKLDAFYSRMRRKVIEAQAKQSAEMLEEQMAAALGIREIWQVLDLRGGGDSGPEILPPAQAPRYGGMALAQMDRRQLSWSA